MYGKDEGGGGGGGGGVGKQLIWERRVVSTISLLTGKLGQMPSKGNIRRLETIKDKNIWKKLPLFGGRILALTGTYGSHLMTVMIFVTQNNFKTGPGIFDRLLGFYQSYAKYLIWEVCKVTNNRDTAVKRTVKTKWLPISSACYDLANKEGNHDSVASSH